MTKYSAESFPHHKQPHPHCKENFIKCMCVNSGVNTMWRKLDCDFHLWGKQDDGMKLWNFVKQLVLWMLCEHVTENRQNMTSTLKLHLKGKQ